MRPVPLTDSRLVDAGGFVADIQVDDLVYFCCNVGDGDAQVLLLPVSPDGVRRVIVVDAGATQKIPALLRSLEAHHLVSFADPGATTIALVVATHPHHDHISGLAELFEQFGAHVGEFWEPGFFHTSATYTRTLQAVARLPNVVYAQPTSGLRRFFGPVALTVLSPSIHLRNRFDTYGVEINDSSISLRVEHPARAVADTVPVAEGQANFGTNPRSATLILGADAQTLSWSYVATDFPYLAASGSEQAKAIKAATGGKDMLSADILKVAHHASKHGVNLELVERIRPAVTVISSTSSGAAYGFPHSVTQLLIREALDPVAGTVDAAGANRDHGTDEDLGIFYTSDTTSAAGDPVVGSFGIILRGRRRRLWRFFDDTGELIDLSVGRRWT